MVRKILNKKKALLVQDSMPSYFFTMDCFPVVNWKNLVLKTESKSFGIGDVICYLVPFGNTEKKNIPKALELKMYSSVQNREEQGKKKDICDIFSFFF